MTGEQLDITVPVDSCTIIPEGYNQPAHYWDIAQSGTTISIGTCRNCGKEREFRNSQAEKSWRTTSVVKVER